VACFSLEDIDSRTQTLFVILHPINVFSAYYHSCGDERFSSVPNKCAFAVFGKIKFELESNMAHTGTVGHVENFSQRDMCFFLDFTPHFMLGFF
jgi:hypothetical protein